MRSEGPRAGRPIFSLAAVLALMVFFGNTDYRRPADAVVVFGARAFKIAAQALHFGFQPFKPRFDRKRLGQSGTRCDQRRGSQKSTDQRPSCFRHFALSIGPDVIPGIKGPWRLQAR